MSATIRSIHRYPVKSLLGETLERALLGENGIPGDRAWATRDEVRGGIRGAKKIPALMECSARYLEEPGSGPAPAAEITPREGASFLTSDPEASQRLTKAIGHEVSLWPLLPADQLEHYQRGAPDSEDFMEELRATFGREPDEPLPDLGAFPPELLQYESPPGTYFDAYPLLLISENGLRAMAATAGDSVFDVRRFRPNLLLDCGEAAGFPEHEWAGQRARVGEALLQFELVCPRCVMTTHGFADLPKDPTIMRSLVRETGGNLGIYANVVEPGVVSAGDTLVPE
jgi:hypothetical protein